ncbi:MAG: leucine-rich repeat domain-containing protein [Promethearchaeota archaeon]
MGKATPKIMEGDLASDLGYFILEACGLGSYDIYDININGVLTREIFENNFDKVMKEVKSYSFNHEAFLVLGYFVLLTGANITEKLRQKIYISADWINEAGTWPDECIDERKFHLKDLQEKIKNHRPGQITRLIRLRVPYEEYIKNGIIGIDQYLSSLNSSKFNSIKHINLDGCELETFPDSLFGFKLLESLSLDNNSIRTLPENISKLKDLKKLYIDGNNLEFLPESIGELQSLEILSVERNSLKALPNSLKSLPSLKTIKIRKNLIKKISEHLKDRKKWRIFIY